MTLLSSSDTATKTLALRVTLFMVYIAMQRINVDKTNHSLRWRVNCAEDGVNHLLARRCWHKRFSFEREAS